MDTKSEPITMRDTFQMMKKVGNRNRKRMTSLFPNNLFKISLTFPTPTLIPTPTLTPTPTLVFSFSLTRFNDTSDKM